ncbi:hypothetical protein WJX84_011067 [Apatococcus fuscideae]|uniref:Uncharacterized protein n=1 Tax=Apatococcus fuscideae TaxID=2026836 RepID=A0AAW1SW47_9CHLO
MEAQRGPEQAVKMLAMLQQQDMNNGRFSRTQAFLLPVDVTYSLLQHRTPEVQPARHPEIQNSQQYDARTKGLQQPQEKPSRPISVIRSQGAAQGQTTTPQQQAGPATVVQTGPRQVLASVNGREALPPAAQANDGLEAFVERLPLDAEAAGRLLGQLNKLYSLDEGAPEATGLLEEIREAVSRSVFEQIVAFVVGLVNILYLQALLRRKVRAIRADLQPI